MSIRPQYVAKILNGEKTIEVRKKFPKDYVGWVYIYCTKGKKILMAQRGNFKGFELINTKDYGDYVYTNICECLNGKVVARFWCDKVEEIECISVGDSDYGSLYADTEYCTETLSEKELTQKSCVLPNEIFEYLDEDFDKVGYAIHISKLEVFDKPKELKEFYKVGAWKVFEEQFDSSYLKREQQEIMEELEQTITKAPQSYMFVEGE